jgi:hypothetical protein
MVIAVQCGMPISEQALRECIHNAGFPLAKREFVFVTITAGLATFRENRVRSYYGATGKTIKNPTSAHSAARGRYDQTLARHVLIAALYRAWFRGFGVAPTLNHKLNPDSAFCSFAIDVMSREGIGRIHKHLEKYWSFSRLTIEKNSKQGEK